MALDLSMKACRRHVERSVYDSCGRGRLEGWQGGPVKLTKRVRFQDNGASHPYLHPDVVRARLLVKHCTSQVVDSDEENRPPSATMTSQCERLHERQVAPHPATLEGHVTTPTPASRRENMFITLPSDPREWSREDVSNWLIYMRVTHNLTDIQHDRFLMNGKALCLMNANMFSYRVPVGGKFLYRDFRMRLSRALSTQPQTPTSVSAAAATSGPPVASPARA